MRVTILVLITTLAALTGCSRTPQNFETPEAAVQALVEASKSDGDRALLKILGKAAEPIVDSGDPVADKNARENFVAAYTAANSLDKSVEEWVTLDVGEDKWPFPIPIVKGDKGWYFDSEIGAEEIINRRIGANELDTIQSCLAYVDAQREYYIRNAPQDPLQHYAKRLISTDGKKDGLYWPTTEGEELSPLGEGFAQARAEGYLQKSNTMSGVPFHGYIYRMLNKQGPNAPGGAYDYVVNDELLGGFALVAFPAEYGNSGVMTFIVSHDGVVYSRDLGTDTTNLAMAMDTFDPGTDWKKEEGEQVALR